MLFRITEQKLDLKTGFIISVYPSTDVRARFIFPFTLEHFLHKSVNKEFGVNSGRQGSKWVNQLRSTVCLSMATGRLDVTWPDINGENKMPKDLIIVIITTSAVALSAAIDRKRTAKGIVKGWRMLRKLLPQFLLMLIFVSVFLALLPKDVLARFLGQHLVGAAPIVAALLGSAALIPAPIAYPLAGMLRESGVSISVLAIFITTLMMVGILTFPVEKAYLGTRIAILRNFLSFIGALLIGLIIGGLL